MKIISLKDLGKFALLRSGEIVEIKSIEFHRHKKQYLPEMELQINEEEIYHDLFTRAGKSKRDANFDIIQIYDSKTLSYI